MTTSNPENLPVKPSFWVLARTHLTEVPALVEVPKPKFHLSDAQESFLVRFGASVIFVIHSVEHAISPSGALRAFIGLFMKWFITSAIFVGAVGGVLLMASTFLESITGLMALIAKNVFIFAVYLLATVVVLAILFTGIVFALKKKKEHEEA